MLPIIYQLLEHSTCSGRAELMVRCEKGQLSTDFESALQSCLAQLLQAQYDHLEVDTLRDHTADWIYIFSQSRQIQSLLIELFRYCNDQQMEMSIHAVYIAHEDCESPEIEGFLKLLQEQGRDYALIQ